MSAANDGRLDRGGEEKRRPGSGGEPEEAAPVDPGEIEIVSIEAVDERGEPIDPAGGAPPQEGTPTDAGTVGAEPWPAQAGADAAPTPAEEALREAIGRLQERYIRLDAEFDSYRRRRDRDMEEVRWLAAQKILLDALPLDDNLERAVASLPEGTTGPLREGLDLIRHQFQEFLRAQGVAEVEALGEPFDPAFHEAAVVEQRDDFEDERVIEIMQRGYMFEGRLLRPALVKVVCNPARGSGPERPSGPCSSENRSGQDPARGGGDGEERSWDA